MKILRDLFLKSIFLLLISFSSIQAQTTVNSLISRDVRQLWNTKSAFIENIVLVSEPHGAYVEQSMYFKYTDHNAFPGSDRVEFVHRFELPEGSVVNDLWLWMGDSVMKAILLDTWTASHKYDSIVYPPNFVPRDPALLVKRGNQYELRVFPLVSGSFRKLKINFITPTKWYGNYAITEMPLKFLQASASSNIPITMLFRTKASIWGTPGIMELPTLGFASFQDTAGYSYERLFIDNIKNLSTYRLSYQTNFPNGLFFANNIIPNDLNYFQFGFKPWEALHINNFDTIPHKTIIGIDLSGYNYRNYSTLIPNLKYSIKAALKPEDQFNILVAGAGEIKSLSNTLLPFTDANVDNLFNQFLSSPQADSIKKIKMDSIFCADNDAWNWRWLGMENYVIPKFYDYSILSTHRFFINYDKIIISHHGYLNLEPNQLAQIVASMDSAFNKGAKIIQYSGTNNNYTGIQKNYIPSFNILNQSGSNVKLFKNPGGYFSSSLPDSIIVPVVHFFAPINDGETRVEMYDSQERPVIVSKKVSNGYYIICGVDLNDYYNLYDTHKEIIISALFNLNNTGKGSQLKNILNNYKEQYTQNNINQFITFSNSDTLTNNITLTNDWVNNYLTSFSVRPMFSSVNLVNGSIYGTPYVQIGSRKYLNSGYLMKRLADETDGMHIENYFYTWDNVIAMLDPEQPKFIDSIKVTPVFQGASDSLKEMIEVNIDRGDMDRPLFFFGSTNSNEQIRFNVDVKFDGVKDIKHGSFDYYFSTDTVNTAKIVATMMGYEKLKERLLNHSNDTSTIVNLGIKFNLLCDYTAFMAFEPNDTIHFLTNYIDESRLPVTDDANLIDSTYSL
ncbi:MAG: hypothetical protein ACM3O3_01975, partial [Syntrophothermus sp.]